MVGPVRRLMRQRRVVALGIAERLEQGQHDAVSRRPVERPAATVAQFSACCREELLRVSDPLRRRS